VIAKKNELASTPSDAGDPGVDDPQPQTMSEDEARSVGLTIMSEAELLLSGTEAGSVRRAEAACVMINEIDTKELVDRKLVALGVSNLKYLNRSLVGFYCSGKYVRCFYENASGDPSLWYIELDECIISRNMFLLTRNSEPAIRFFGVDICECVTLMARPYEIAWAIHSWLIPVASARREILTLVSDCATFQEASEMLNQRPQLYAEAKYQRLSSLWGYVTRRRSRLSRKRNLNAPLRVGVLHLDSG
jgi:hypothetical protein